MKRAHTIRIGQIVGAGLGLTLFLALVVGLAGRIAYDVSKRQNALIQTRAEVDSLTLELQILAIRRTDTLRRYLDTRSATYLVVYRDNELAYEKVFTGLTPLLRTPPEVEAWQAVVAAETALDNKAQEAFSLYDNGFPESARFLWELEGLSAQDNLLESIKNLRQVQTSTGSRIIDSAVQTENLAISAVSVFIFLALLGGIAASLIITRIITRPLSQLVKTTSAIGSDLSQRVKPAGPQEIAFLGQTINNMAASLAVSRRALQEYNERLEHELELASQIQASFFPDSLPRFPGLELAAFWQSAREMGGDFYTCINLGEGQLGLVVADVSGKGAPAAMAGALAVGLLEAYAPLYPKPETLLARLNKDLHARFIANYINVACCYTILDTNSLHLTVANAGCVYPYLRRRQNLHEVEVFGLPLGMWPDFDYQSQQLALCPGDLLLLSSDGLIEARNEQGELFGFDRLEAELKDLPANVTAQAAVDRLVGAAITFTGNMDLADDLTVLVIQATEK